MTLRRLLSRAARVTGLPSPRAGVAWLLMAAASGCDGPQSILGSESAAPRAIESLWWVSLASTGFLSLLVFGGLAWAVVRARRADDGSDVPRTERGSDSPKEPPSPPLSGWGKEEKVILLLGGGIPGLFLVGFLLFSVRVGAEVSPPVDEAALEVEVVGHMFWWEVRYPEWGIVTANELRIPTGVPVHLRVTSADVIHSFWVPQLGPGKIDMIPGRTNLTWLRAEAPGRYRGQCTEFCGVQHALMSFLVIAEAPEDFDAWLRDRRALDPLPVDEEGEVGLGVFLAEGCAACHYIAGVADPGAAGRPGPDLTDMGARETLGALTVENTRENLRRWIVDPHQFKPGVRMPGHRIPEAELEALVSYLAGLGS